MSDYIPTIEKMISEFGKLPGVGKKTATRYALAVLDWDEEKVASFLDAVSNMKSNVKRCNICNNLCENTDKCSICSDKTRDNIICVVEDARAVMTIERVREYHGKYHVLDGALSPMNGIGPDKLKIKELLSRIATETIDEIIIATNPTIEGEATAVYLTNLLKKYDIKVTRLVYGIPVGSAIEYADEVTLYRAIDGRREI